VRLSAGFSRRVRGSPGPGSRAIDQAGGGVAADPVFLGQSGGINRFLTAGKRDDVRLTLGGDAELLEMRSEASSLISR